jgi:hypothetical protein
MPQAAPPAACHPGRELLAKRVITIRGELLAKRVITIRGASRNPERPPVSLREGGEDGYRCESCADKKEG